MDLVCVIAPLMNGTILKHRLKEFVNIEVFFDNIDGGTCANASSLFTNLNS